MINKIEIKTFDRISDIKWNEETCVDILYDDNFLFRKGKTYGLTGEQGSGAYTISALLSGKVDIRYEKIYFDNIEVCDKDIKINSWSTGEAVYHENSKKELTVKEQLEDAIKVGKRYSCIEQIIEEFHLSIDRLNYPISHLSAEGWRASLAIGFAYGKQIFCLPFFNTSYMYDVMINSAMYVCFEFMKEKGAIIILPTTKRENVNYLADECIEMKNPRFNRICEKNEFFIDFYKNNI